MLSQVTTSLGLSLSLSLSLVLLLGYSPQNVASMNIATCEDNSGFTLVPDMNGFSVYVDGYTLDLLDSESASLNESGNARTYRECLAHATSEARIRLASRTVDDAPFLNALRKVPFKISNGPTGDGSPEHEAVHFAYSGRCARGCVYSHLPERLIRDIADSPDLFMHEYAHVLHLATESSAQSSAQAESYSKFMSDERPRLETSYTQPYIPGSCCFWYAAANKYEFFAVTTQAFFLEGSEGRWDWPKSSALLQTESPAAFEVAVDYWGISEDDLLAAMGECTIPWFETLSEEQAIAIAAGIFALVIITGAFACYYFSICNKCCKRVEPNGGRGTMVGKENELL